MGSYCDLRVSGFSLIAQKYRVPSEVLSIFTEADKATGCCPPDETDSDDQERGFNGYCSTAGAIADRLDLMGFTPEAARADFASSIDLEIQDQQGAVEIWEQQQDEHAPSILLRYRTKIEFLTINRFTFDQWLSAVSQTKDNPARRTDYDAAERKWRFSRTLDEIEAHVLNEGDENDHPAHGYYCSDFRFLIRAFLLCAASDDHVVLDTTDMVDAGYFEADDRIVEKARMSAALTARAVEKVLVLTEGKTDSRILRESTELLFPHLREFVSFLDYDSFAVPGGAGNLLNLIQGFAGAGVSNRVIALFDNDTAGTIQMKKAEAMPLPGNFRVLQLPALGLGKNYPTLGPSGPILADINGLACSLELYLGESALTDNTGNLIPVQWTGYERPLSRYQGELIDKRPVQDRYLELLRCGKAQTSDIATVLKLLLAAFHSGA